ncbi:hypothetical protein EWM64_g8785 [Hericium alpestre]|uniref:RING-type domain-containing protein n=1 Tax=Hericium alpestre TaxID=135208 RepID=A0A4Y9ZMB6_9AGAM|nr:hypothetical protein EWM64_g8785 [Hericium alpestre]
MFKFKLDPDVKMIGAGAEAVVAPAYRHRALDPPKPKISPKQENPPKQEPPKQEIVASKVAHYNDPADSDVEMENFVNGVLPPAEEDERYDEQGNFYGRGRDMFQGPTAKADDIDRFLVEAGNAEQFDGNANVAKALEKLQLPGLYAPIPGMQIALMPHQVIGVAWMLEREKSYSKGGCLSDEMGLGKTVQTLATMVSNKSSDPRVKTTLIVAPVALLDQWQMEIEMKTDCGMKCYIYHGSNKIRKMNNLLEYDVVLTSFHTLAHEWPDPEEEERKQKKAEKEKKAGKGKKKNGIDGFVVDDSDDENAGAPKKRTREKKLGLLMQTEWYRVILDEGQNIRNKKTRVSRAVTMLESTYRWVLTGTPIINGLTDAYALLRFLKIRPWYDWDEFHKQIGCHEKKNPKLASSRLQAIFAAVLLRRKKDSMLDGKRLVELPPKSVELVRLEFTAEEREIYSMVEAQSQAIFNRFLRAGTKLSPSPGSLAPSPPDLRPSLPDPGIRQCQRLYRSGRRVRRRRSPRARAELARARELISDEFVARMKYKLREAALQRMEAEKESKDATVEPDECPICFDTFTDAIVTPCTHIFCKECILNVLHLPHVEDANDQHKYKAHERPCPTCRSAISGDRLFTRAAFEPTDEDLEAASNAAHPIQQVKEDRDSDIEMLDDEAISDFKGKAKAKPKRTRRKSKTYIDSEDDSEHEDLDDDLSDFIAADDEDEEEENEFRRKLRKRAPRNRAIILDSDEEDEVVFGRPKKQEPVLQDVKGKGKMQLMSKFLPSTKMKHMMDLILQWAKDHPDEKTLVISQWTQCLQLVSDYMVENAVAHVKYQGNMDRNNRDKAVRVFMSKESAPVMLMSLKCGGVGLNLVRANRVISLDLAWSEAIESQALVIANTVEDRVLAMQERKKNLADGALGEGTGKKIGRLSVKELANLFGLDHRGRVL